MKKLGDIYEKFMPDFMKMPLIKTHSEFLLSILREYDEKLCSLFYYGTITYRDKYILVGTEYEYVSIDMVNEEDAKTFFGMLIRKKGIPLSFKELYRTANVEESDNIYIPVYVDNKKIFCVCSKKKQELLSYLSIMKGEDIYEKYPLLMQILKWGISYILSNDGKEQIYERIVAEAEKSARYISEKEIIAEDVFHELMLPFVSTIHAIASWNYEGKANFGFIDFGNPYEAGQKDVIVKFEKNISINIKKARTIRKYVELSDDNFRLKAKSSRAYISGTIVDDAYWHIEGLGESENTYATIRFEGRCQWSLYLEKEIIVYDGVTYTFMNKKEREQQYKVLTKIFYKELEWITQKYDSNLVDKINDLIELASKQKHGTMVIFSERAVEEAERLCTCGRGIKIQPIDVSDLLKANKEVAQKVMNNLTKIDGALIFSEQGVCYSIGTIVDGRACDNSNPGRGARYNSAYTYVYDCNERGIRCYGAVISEDGTIDVFGMFGKGQTESIIKLMDQGKRVVLS